MDRENMIIHMNGQVIWNRDVSVSVVIDNQEMILTFSTYYRTLLQMWKTWTPEEGMQKSHLKTPTKTDNPVYIQWANYCLSLTELCYIISVSCCLVINQLVQHFS